ncbi:hypothetical protein Y695_03608 [Hydrogenophaga sp. T4]|nr:hypothetical protein Y695_03608 [Hydrogenophaga sp. T4]
MHRLGREDRIEQPRIRQHAGVRTGLTRQPLECLHFKLQALGRGLEAVCLLVDQVAKGVCGFGEQLLRLLLFQIGFDLRAHFVKTARFGRLDIGQLDDVKTEVGLDHVGDRAFFQRKHRVFKGLDHGATPEIVQVAAIGRRARIFRLGLGHGCEGLRGFANLFEQRLRTLAHGIFFCRGRARGHAQEDVAGTALFVARQTGHVLLVVRTHIGFVEAHRPLQGRCVQHQVFHVGLLGGLEQSRVLLVEALDIGIGGLNAAGLVGSGKALHAHFASFEEGIERQLGQIGRYETGTRHALPHLLFRQVGPHTGLVHLGRHAWRPTSCL